MDRCVTTFRGGAARFAGVFLAGCVLACSSGPDSDEKSATAPAVAEEPAAVEEKKPVPESARRARYVGVAFVDSAVTGEGSRAVLPPGTKIYPDGAEITGTEECPTTKYKTDGLPVAVIEYQGRPTSARVNVIRRPESGGAFAEPPYTLNLDPGQKIQMLDRPHDVTGKGSFTLERDCPSVD